MEERAAVELKACCRYMYNESLGRWRTADLLIGLAYLARQESANRAIADIAAAGNLVGCGQSKAQRQSIVVKSLDISSPHSRSYSLSSLLHLHEYHDSLNCLSSSPRDWGLSQDAGRIDACHSSKFTAYHNQI